MSRHRRPVGSATAGVLPSPPGYDPLKTYKGVQVQIFTGAPVRPLAVDLANPGAGLNPPSSIRVISPWDSSAATLLNYNGYLAGVQAQGIKTTVCIDMQSNMPPATWKDAVRAHADGLTAADTFELGNERDGTFAYNGAGTNWNKFFDAVQDACDVLDTEYGGKHRILGAARDTNTDGLTSAARTRWGATASLWPVDGVAIHPYGHAGNTSGLNWFRTNALDNEEQKLEQARSHVPMGLRFWITEMGWSVGVYPNSTMSVLGGGGTQAQRNTEQGAILSDAYRRLWARRFSNQADVDAAGGNAYGNGNPLGIAVIGWFMWHHVNPITTWWQSCGLVDNAEVKLPSWSSFMAEDTFRAYA